MQIYLSKDGQQYGPYTSDQLREYVQHGNFTNADHACFDGQNWVTVKEVPGFANGDLCASTYPQEVETMTIGSNKKKIILWSSIGVCAALLVTGLIIAWWEREKPIDGQIEQGDDNYQKTSISIDSPKKNWATNNGSVQATVTLNSEQVNKSSGNQRIILPIITPLIKPYVTSPL